MHVLLLLLLLLLLLCLLLLSHVQLPLLPRLVLLEAPSLTGALTISMQAVCCCGVPDAQCDCNSGRSLGPELAE
jgi:hypothetical protein